MERVERMIKKAEAWVAENYPEEKWSDLQRLVAFRSYYNGLADAFEKMVRDGQSI